MRESKIEKFAVKSAKAFGVLTVKLNGPGHRGWPDRLFVKGDRALFMEFKATGRKPTPQQRHRLRQLAKAGCRVAIVDSNIAVAVEMNNNFGVQS